MKTKIILIALLCISLSSVSSINLNGQRKKSHKGSLKSTQNWLKTLGKNYSLDELAKLEELDLSSNKKVTDKNLKNIRSLKNLKVLSLNWTNISNKGLVHLKNLYKLEDLDIGITKITDSGLINLKRLRNLKKLNLQALVHTSFKEVKIKISKKEYKIVKIEKKVPGDMKISNAGLRHLKGLRNLEELNLSGAIKVTDKGMIYLRRLSKLKRLYLDSSEISNKGLSYLKVLKKLEYLNVSKTKVNSSGINKFKKDLPSCNVRN